MLISRLALDSRYSIIDWKVKNKKVLWFLNLCELFEGQVDGKSVILWYVIKLNVFQRKFNWKFKPPFFIYTQLVFISKCISAFQKPSLYLKEHPYTFSLKVGIYPISEFCWKTSLNEVDFTKMSYDNMYTEFKICWFW